MNEISQSGELPDKRTLTPIRKADQTEDDLQLVPDENLVGPLVRRKSLLLFPPNIRLTELELQALNHAASQHRALLTASQLCGCFRCLSVFGSKDIRKWIHHDKTALCPRCGEAAVIGDASWPRLTRIVLSEMHQRWFER